jgi:ankyrin repeat protein
MRERGIKEITIAILITATLFCSTTYGNDSQALINAIRSNYKWGQDPQRGTLEQAREFLEQGVDVNAKDKDVKTALIIAVEHGDEEVAKLLLDCGADVNEEYDGQTASEIAMKRQFKALADFLRSRGGRTASDLRTAKYSDRVTVRGEEMFFRLKDGKIVSRKNSPPEEADGYSDVIGQTNVNYRFIDFIEPWFVIGESYMEGHGVLLLNRNTGQSVTVSGEGLLAPDKKRFLAIGYVGESPCDVEIWKITNAGLVKEYVWEGGCLHSFRWADSSTVEAISYNDHNRKDNYTVIARIKREAGGKWSYSQIDKEIVVVGGTTEGATDDPDEKALIWASREGAVKSVRKLLRKSINLNAIGDNGRTALEEASQGGHAEIVKLLLEKGADFKGARNVDPLTRAAWQGHIEVVNIFVSHGAKLTLQAAAAIGDREAVLRLIKEGADINASEPWNRSAFYNAVRNRQWDTAILLLENGVQISDEYGRYRALLAAAAMDGHIGIIAWLLKKRTVKPEDVSSALETAAGEGKLNIAELLLNHGADVNVKDKYDRTPLMAAAVRGQYDMVGVLLAKGADVNTRSEAGVTALMDASWGADPETIKLLLRKGARIDEQDKSGRTALMIAPNEEIRKLLRGRGAKELNSVGLK